MFEKERELFVVIVWRFILAGGLLNYYDGTLSRLRYDFIYVILKLFLLVLQKSLIYEIIMYSYNQGSFFYSELAIFICEN